MTQKFTKTTLANGLTLLLKEIHTAPMISSWVWYRVGSRNESTGKTGISHWVEHMQFKGTPKFPANILDKAISREGGVWNAFTHLDFTTYYETMPAEKIDFALELEADRMQNSLFDPEEVASERTVIISEREGSENSPMFKLSEVTQATSFRVHPYHHKVIGDMADLESMTRDDLYEHYKSFYAPNNAIMTIAGDFETEKMLKRVKELFGGIPAAPAPRQLSRPEPESSGETHLTVEGTGDTTFVQASYPFPSATDPDFFPLSVLDSLLSGASSLNMFGGGISNKTSRLYKALVETELTVGMSGGAQATLDPYLYNIVMVIHPEREPDEALAALDTEILRIQEEKVSEKEVARAVKQAKALFAYGSESITNQAFWMGYTEIFANYEWFETYIDNLAAVSPDDVQRVAKKYFQKKSRVVGTYLPVNEENSND
ncbi:MAG: insulinase family protein [Anaerolineae bacterium]|nr:insulinase family protein [Anaerolineae bacterium]MBT7075388.1 insulinase family protein [Anaerolineae bacterium]MBT7781371.1 insulinase family protein [Anaerolineae bacterium]